MRNLVKLLGLMIILTLTSCQKDELENETPVQQFSNVSNPNDDNTNDYPFENLVYDQEGNPMDLDGYVVIIKHSEKGTTYGERKECGYTLESGNWDTDKESFVLAIDSNELLRTTISTTFLYDTYYISGNTFLCIKPHGKNDDYNMFMFSVKEYKNGLSTKNVVKSYTADFDNSGSSSKYTFNPEFYNEIYTIDDKAFGTYTIDDELVIGHTYTPDTLIDILD